MHNPLFELDQAAGIAKMNQSKGIKVYAVTSGKGGVGKSNIAVNLGISLTELGQRVALLDADMGLANIDVLLGLQPKYNISHLLNGERSLDEIMITGPGGMKIIPACSGIQKMTDLSSFEQTAVIHAFSEINEHIDVLIVDTAAGISSSVVDFARACQEIIVVICDEPTSLTDGYAFIKLLNRDYGVYRFHILTNMVRNARQGEALFTKLGKVTNRYLDISLNYFGSVPDDEYLRKAVQKQCAVRQVYPSSPSAQAFKNLAQKIEARPVTENPGGQIQFFIECMIESSRANNEALV